MVANMIDADPEDVAAESGIDVWAAIPFDRALGAATDRGVPYAVASPDAAATRAIMQLADRVEYERGGRLAP
jgi:Flp pilus assembly CpaE family ATPase